MKVAVDITASIYEGTGVATYYNNLIPELINYGQGIDFKFFGYSLRGRERFKLATKVFPIPPTVMEVLWNRLHLFPIERLVGDCDVYHAWDYIHAPVKKAKFVTTIHDITPVLFPKQQHPRTISSYKRTLKWIKKIDADVITDSFASKNDLIKHINLPESKVHVIYLSVNKQFSEFRVKSQREQDYAINWVRSKYKIPDDYILFVGANEPRKNLHKLVQAFKLLDLKIDLVIAGNAGWGKQVTPNNRIKKIGFVKKSELPALYAGSSCFVYPSLYEGFGLPILEAMAVGCPVVTTRRGSLEEVAGDSAIFVNPDKKEAIASGINTALHEKDILSQKGIERSKQFSWEKTAKETIKVYNKISQQ